MNFLKNQSIKTKLLVNVLIPLCAIIILSFILIYTNYSKYDNYTKLEKIVALNSKISLLIHETQKERGTTAGFLASKGKKFHNKLPKQRIKTDKRIKELEDYLKKYDLTTSIPKKGLRLLNNTLNKLKALQTKRSQITSLSIGLKDALSYYTNINSNFIKLITQTFDKSEDSYLTINSIAYYSFLQAKERAGIERAIGSSIFSKNKANSSSKNKFLSLISKQESFLLSFESLASEKLLNFKNQTLQGDVINQVNIIYKHSPRKRFTY